MQKLTQILIVGTILLTTVFAPQKSVAAGTLKQNLATVIFCGLGGAVIGISTLSFYGEPQEKIGNVYTGFAVGLIAGSVYVASNSMTDSSYKESAFDKLKREKPLSYPLLAQWNWAF